MIPHFIELWTSHLVAYNFEPCMYSTLEFVEISAFVLQKDMRRSNQKEKLATIHLVAHLDSNNIFDPLNMFANCLSTVHTGIEKYLPSLIQNWLQVVWKRSPQLIP